VIKWIRWQGLVAFVVLTGLLSILWWLLLDRFVKHTVERAGTAIIGAKVELDAADVTLLPLGVTLSRLQVANPDNPMTNAVEIARITGTVDPLNLFRRKIIMEEMAVEGVRLNTPRQTSGSVVDQALKNEEINKPGDGFTLPALELRDPKMIVEQELAGLKAVKLLERLQADLEIDKTKWKQRIAGLPDKGKFDEYKKRIDSLTSAGKRGFGGMLGGLEEVGKIQAEARRDVERLTDAKQELEQTMASLKTRAADAADAAKEDVARLRSKYAVSGEGVTNITRAVVAGPMSESVETAFRWYRRLEPLLSRPAEQKAEVEVARPLRGTGVDVRFKEQAPLPDFLIRTTHVSVELSGGTLQGRIDNITPDPEVLAVPLTFAFAGEKFKNLSSVTFDGTVDRTNPAKQLDTAKLRVTAYRLDRVGLVGEAAPLSLKQGMADVEIRAVLMESGINATVGSRVRSAQLVAGKRLAAGPLGAAIAGALADMDAFQFKAEVTGTQDQYEVTMTSDIDEMLADAVGKQVRVQVAKLEEHLRSEVDEKIKARMREIQHDLAEFAPLAQEMTGRVRLAQDLLKPGTIGMAGKSGFNLPF
jgi:uncharacterized protein (TIGR03545 family)